MKIFRNILMEKNVLNTENEKNEKRTQIE
jgi:hypothetical protein